MQKRASFFERLPSIKWVVKACLLAQVGVAGVLMSEHIWSDHTLAGTRSIKPVETREVTPGDQSRPFVRVGFPSHEDQRRRTGSPIALPDDLPPRLEFSLQDSEEHGRILLVAGAIQGGDAQRFEAYLASLETPVAVVAIHSSGGRVSEALRIGRTIREQELQTLVAPDAACVSACPYMFAGGVERIAAADAWIGLHQHYYDNQDSILPAFLAVQGVQAGQAETMTFLNDMDVDPLIMVHALKTPPEEVYFLVEEELTRYRLATRIFN